MADGRIYYGTNVDGGKTVSIIIPVYNTEKYIDACLKSVVNQSYPFMDIILINDGSTDRSGDKCQRWSSKDSRIRYFKRENSGLGNTRNFGIQIAYGQYIMFLDSDDWVEECFVEHMYLAISRKDADMAFCDYYKVSEKDGKQSVFLTKLYTQEIISAKDKSKLIYGADVAMWIKIYRRSLFFEHNIQIPDGPYEDTAIYPIIVAACKKIVHVKEKLLYYRIDREGSILSTRSNRKYAVKALEHLFVDMKKRGIFQGYQEELERFSARFVSYSLREMKLEYFEKNRKHLISFIHEIFRNIDVPYGKRFLSMGSNNLYCIINQIPYDLDYTTKVQISDQYEKTLSVDDYDYAALDFQEDRIEQSRLDNKEIERLAFFLSKLERKRIILVKSRLAFTYGEYSGTDSFTNQEQIRQANKRIEEKEQAFLKKVGKPVYIIESVKKYLEYSDIHSRHGCRPYHMNDSYYLDMADRLIKKLRRENQDEEDNIWSR